MLFDCRCKYNRHKYKGRLTACPLGLLIASVVMRLVEHNRKSNAEKGFGLVQNVNDVSVANSHKAFGYHGDFLAVFQNVVVPSPDVAFDSILAVFCVNGVFFTQSKLALNFCYFFAVFNNEELRHNVYQFVPYLNKLITLHIHNFKALGNGQQAAFYLKNVVIVNVFNGKPIADCKNLLSDNILHSFPPRVFFYIIPQKGQNSNINGKFNKRDKIFPCAAKKVKMLAKQIDIWYYKKALHAGVMELADVVDSKSTS